MRVFVTGATGYIGGAVARRLIADGHKVVGLARSDASAERLRSIGATPHLGDLSNSDALRTGVQAADAVIHAAFGHDDWSRMDLSFEQDEAAVQTMLGALAGSGRTFIYTSGSGVLGPTAADFAWGPGTYLYMVGSGAGEGLFRINTLREGAP